MRFGRQMHDGIGLVPGKYPVQGATVADVYLFEGVAWAVGHRGQSPQVAGIGKLVDIDHGIGGISCGVRGVCCGIRDALRSEEHTSELQSLMRISYAVFCLKKKN